MRHADVHALLRRMENGTVPTHDALADAREWLRQRDAHKDELIKELEVARALVAEIERLLGELGVDVTAVSSPAMTRVRRTTQRSASPRGFEPRRATVPQVIAFVLRGTKGMDIGAIIKEVQSLKPGVGRQVIYPAVYRMAKDDRLRHVGDKYLPPEGDSDAK